MISIGSVIGLILAIVANAAVVFLNLWIAYSMKREYLKLKDPVYIKSALESKKWMGKPITPKLIKKMSISTLIGAFVFALISFYIIFSMGPNQMWAVFLAVSIILAYACYQWINYIKIKEKIVVNDVTVKKASKWSQILVLPFMAIIVLAMLYKDWMMSSPVFQIWIIGFAVFITFISEISRKLFLK